MNAGSNFRHRAKRGDDNWYLVFGADHEVLLQALVGAMDDLVDGKRRGRLVRVGAVMRGKGFGDFREPFIQLRCRTRIQRRKRTDNTCLALGNDQSRIGNDEQGSGDDRKPESVFQNRRQGHQVLHKYDVYANVNICTKLSGAVKARLVMPAYWIGGEQPVEPDFALKSAFE